MSHEISFDDGKFRVSVNIAGQLHIEAHPDVSAAELLNFQCNITQHLFAKAAEADRLAMGADKSLPADAQVEFRDERSITLCEGKYEIGISAEGAPVALRYGEPWRNCVGDNLLAALYEYACDLEDVKASTDKNLRLIDESLNGENAAESPSACDIASQLYALQKNGIPLLERLQFNGLDAAQAERLFLLLEERAESIQAAAKILRHGYESYDPTQDDGPSNREALENEEGDGCAAMDMLVKAGDIDVGSVVNASIRKSQSVKQWLHHQPKENPNAK